VFNHPPHADAGPDQAGINPGVTITLDGSGSFDLDAGQTLTYTWLQTAGIPVTLSNVHAIKPTFTAPVGPTAMSFQLTVSDGHASDQDSVNIGVTGIPFLNVRDELAGAALAGKTSTVFTLTVYNAGSVTASFTQANIHNTLTINGVAVPASQLTIPNTSKTLKGGTSTTVKVTWKGKLLAGQNLHVQSCVDVTGDYFPADNCSAIDQPGGPAVLSTTQNMSFIIHTETSDAYAVKLKNNGTSTVSVPTSASSMSFSVNGGTATVVHPSGSTLTMKSGASATLHFTWNHLARKANDVVTTQTCVNVASVGGPICTTFMIIVS